MMVGYDRRSDTPARMTNRLYEGTGDGYESRLTVDGRSLAMHNDLGNHSPDDPNSSYFGSGPTQLEARPRRGDGRRRTGREPLSPVQGRADPTIKGDSILMTHAELRCWTGAGR